MTPLISFNVLLQCGLLLLCANCVRLENNEHSYTENRAMNLWRSYSWWPSIHNGAVLRNKRQAAPVGVVGKTEGGEVKPKDQPAEPPAPTPALGLTSTPAALPTVQNKTDVKEGQADPVKGSVIKGNIEAVNFATGFFLYIYIKEYYELF